MIAKVIIFTVIITSGDAISAGWRTVPLQFPYVVAILKQNGEVICGGALIDDTHVLTAAHCIHDYNNYFILAGAAAIRSPRYEMRTVIYSHLHHDYVTSHVPYGCTNRVDEVSHNDVAVLTLDRALPLSDSIATIPLDEVGLDATCEKCDVSGWGYIAPNATTNYLHWMSVKVLSMTECLNALVPITENSLCGINVEMTAAVMPADSGSPLVCGSTLQNRILVGVVSTSACNPRAPAVYTQVSKYIGFIRAAQRF